MLIKHKNQVLIEFNIALKPRNRVNALWFQFEKRNSPNFSTLPRFIVTRLGMQEKSLLLRFLVSKQTTMGEVHTFMRGLLKPFFGSTDRYELASEAD
jgi:hypothetical protein